MTPVPQQMQARRRDEALAQRAAEQAYYDQQQRQFVDNRGYYGDPAYGPSYGPSYGPPMAYRNRGGFGGGGVGLPLLGGLAGGLLLGDILDGGFDGGGFDGGGFDGGGFDGGFF